MRKYISVEEAIKLIHDAFEKEIIPMCVKATKELDEKDRKIDSLTLDIKSALSNQMKARRKLEILLNNKSYNQLALLQTKDELTDTQFALTQAKAEFAELDKESSTLIVFLKEELNKYKSLYEMWKDAKRYTEVKIIP